MRITGGIYKGRKIACPPGIIRPAMDRMRESLFAILGNMEELAFLDLFSGSGIVGIEAASRGAGPVILVEKDFHKRDIIKQNLNFVTSPVQLKIMPAERFIRTCRDNFDHIYIDPPFNFKYKTEILTALVRYRLLNQGGIIIIHQPANESPPVIPPYLLYDERKYGGSILRFYNDGQV